MGWRGCSGAQEVIMIAQKERERRSLGFSPMATLGGGAIEMVSGAPMRR
jgi:hypothetical protein